MSGPATALFTGRIYPGLRPFDAEDALLFFGRDPETDELLRRLDDTRFLAVVGLSGSGKSSLVRAGLLPALRRGHLTGAGSQWRVAVMRPGSDPLGALARVLDETLGVRDDRLRVLRSGNLGLLDATRHGRSADENLLLVVDQFEEIFRFQDTYRQRAGEAAEFVELLLAAAQDYEPAWRVYVVITLRSDYLGECARFRGLPEVLNESQYLVPRMTRDELRDAIVGPAALGGVELNRGLLEELLDRTGDDPDQLPVLQHLLMRMWEVRERTDTGSRIAAEHCTAVGGWDDALNRHADAVWNALGARRDLAKRIFQRLTEKAQAGREVRRPATVRELAGVAEVSADEVIEVAENFRQEGCNFLTSPDRDLTPDSVIDISHESLIRRWQRLNEWTTEEADWGAWYRRLEDRHSIEGAFLTGPELESALEARAAGRWNEVWAVRYATERDGVRPAYSEVMRCLEESRKRRSDEVARLRRTRAIVAVAAILFAALSAFATYFWWSARDARRQAESKAQEAVQQGRKTEDALTALQEQSRKTQSALQEAQDQRALAQKNASEASEQGNQALARQLAADSSLTRSSNADWTAAALLGVESLRRAETVEGYEALWGASGGMGREVVRLAQQNTVNAVAFSPDGALLATGGLDDTARVFEVRTGHEVARLLHQDSVGAVAFSPNGTLVATGSGDKTARVFDARTGREVSRMAHQNMVAAVAFSPNGALLATGALDNTARVFEVRTGHEVARLAHLSYVPAVAFSPDSTLLATGSWDYTARVFEARTGREVAPIRHQDAVSAVAFSPDGALVATGSGAMGHTGEARVFEARTGREVARLAHQDRVSAVAFSPDGTLVATGSADKTARVFEARTGREVARLAHLSYVSAVAFSPDGTLVATASDDHTARVFEARTGREVARLAHQGSVAAVAFSPDGTLVATGSEDKTARVFEARMGREVTRLAHQDTVNAVAVSPDGTLVATGSGETFHTGVAQVFEAHTGRVVVRLAHEGKVNAAVFSRGGTLVATGSGDIGHTGEALVFESRTGHEVARLAYQTSLWALAFSPDDRLVAIGSADFTARVVEARTGREVARLAHQANVSAVAFSPDDTLLATASVDNITRVFEARTGREAARLAHQDWVHALAFSPDSALVATASEDKSARVFDARTGREVARLAHQATVSAVVFSPDGTLLATGSADKTARVFEARTGREAARLALGEPVQGVAFVSGGRRLLAVSGEKVLHVTQAPVRPSDLITEACSKLDRNLTPTEWATYLGKLPYRNTCEQLNSAVVGKHK
jgi:WD40 repeat protein